MLGMHAINITEAVCGLTGLDHIFCGCICVISFFAYEIAVLIYMQSVYYTSGHCKEAGQTPEQYWWLLVNILVYFGFVIIACYFHIRSLCGGPSKEEIEEEEKKRHAHVKQANHVE